MYIIPRKIIWNIKRIPRLCCPTCQLCSAQQKKYQNTVQPSWGEHSQITGHFSPSRGRPRTHKYWKVHDKNLLMSEIMETKIGAIRPSVTRRVDRLCSSECQSEARGGERCILWPVTRWAPGTGSWPPGITTSWQRTPPVPRSWGDFSRWTNIPATFGNLCQGVTDFYVHPSGSDRPDSILHGGRSLCLPAHRAGQSAGASCHSSECQY